MYFQTWVFHTSLLNSGSKMTNQILLVWWVWNIMKDSWSFKYTSKLHKIQSLYFNNSHNLQVNKPSQQFFAIKNSNLCKLRNGSIFTITFLYNLRFLLKTSYENCAPTFKNSLKNQRKAVRQVTVKVLLQEALWGSSSKFERFPRNIS